MKKNSGTNEAEKAFAAEVYRDRAAINRKAQSALASSSRQITIVPGLDQMLLHEALTRKRRVQE